MIALDTSALEQRLEALERAMVAMERRLLAAVSNGHAPAEPDRWMSLKQVAERVGRSKRTVNDMEKREKFPRAATVLNGRKLWRARDVEAWMREQEKREGV